ncbi:hypothetical protein EMIHUDRAFT_422070 [Emiliania huxleyi CCMP1516]|uniref:Roadblock/LAMTOR2 domain-containing protein n=2 Tax=Emiliania huxleyi TaxID=2903 RepID=A0A0D3IB07_EMIH1|nr:hypothetical protein EMIHUDRAFT_374437 [Emiliania huxleyi CCMP1516]XP_005765559.1 hypothetical protein EMIHUDRAFT_422070 [Emiliania huxleyi CCMP1516]EOD08442.1 hypothetical protein EMIHUDRAFT_374437 [Emiliania huxleyi CCMP1516]EOD13130.1 hypothetical protein EMIHUDRAFT_422070 [Emiliania huxleyi CCMP1516]|mmetsp:Transcript_17090/g.55191  ORF Transcript_17090/g.55191 Transcript_17090/m.55191 type:complete len:128 (+) Transcript_17090:70-453(+)|eukprot:XP_005760871.1 hypothetical protein EMIHUDRAFT_374437 [Emiliania huxleyi CCMP1516]
MPADSSFDQLLGRLEGVKTVLVCDPEGAILLCAGDASCEPRLQRLSATYSQTADHTSKLGLGKSRHMTAFCDDCAVVHASCSPIVLSLLVHAGADVAPILDALPELVESLAPLQQAVERLLSQNSRD